MFVWIVSMYSPPASACWPPAKRTVWTRPPTRSRASSTVTRKPARSSSCAATSPARPAPTTTTRPRPAREWLHAGNAIAAPAAAAPATNRRRVRLSSDVRTDKGREDDAVHVVLRLGQRRGGGVGRPVRGRLAHERRKLRHRRLCVPDPLHVGVERLELGVESCQRAVHLGPPLLGCESGPWRLRLSGRRPSKHGVIFLSLE